MSLFRSSPTSLDLNGPTLYFSSQPVGVATSTSSSASLTGIATVSFMTVGDVANPATGTGTIRPRTGSSAKGHAGRRRRPLSA